MKYKTTAKELKDSQYLIVGFNYCQIQNIERYISPSSYIAGVYGWCCDNYDFGTYTLSTGYRPLEWAYPKDAANAKKQAEYIKKEILKLEKKLAEGKIKLSMNPNTNKSKITKRILHIIKKSIEMR